MVDNEVTTIRDIIGNESLTVLSGQEATCSAVQSAMSDSEWVHFACHGVQNGLDSSFVLHDGRLTLTALMARPARDAQFAFLSACQTASGDALVPDESVHLAAGLLFAGFRGAAATLWSIKDEDGPAVAGEFYRALCGREGGMRAEDGARALHGAVQALRRAGVPFVRWVPFIHVGI